MTLLSRVRRLTDPRSLENGLTSSAALGALTLVDPARLSPGGRLAYRGAMAGLAAAGVAIELAADENELYLEPTSRAAITVGAAGLILGMAEVSEHWDARLYRFLDQRGVPRPRLVMAAGTAAFSLASFALGCVLPKSPPGDAEEEVVLQPVPAEVRALVLGMLDATEDYGAAALRAQLDTAQVEAPALDGFLGLIEFVVPDDVPLAVPHDCTFPVRAHLQSDHGRRAQVQLLVQSGRLDALVLESDPDGAEPEEDGLVDLVEPQRWPSLHEVTFGLDSTTP